MRRSVTLPLTVSSRRCWTRVLGTHGVDTVCTAQLYTGCTRHCMCIVCTSRLPVVARCSICPLRWCPYSNLMRSSPMRLLGRMLGIHSMMNGVGSFWSADVFPATSTACLKGHMLDTDNVGEPCNETVGVFFY